VPVLRTVLFDFALLRADVRLFARCVGFFIIPPVCLSPLGFVESEARTFRRTICSVSELARL
jgi:hypothetical protein